MEYTLTATCHFGCESVLKRELMDLGFDIIRVTDGHIEYKSDAAGIFRSNLWLRTAERVQINMIEFTAYTFDELYENIYAFDWVEILPPDANFVINGRSYNSKLFSISDCQRITEKAIIDKLNVTYNKDYYEKTGKKFNFEISIVNDFATLYLDSSGAGLHKRGYRTTQGAAPLKETLAASMINLSVWNKDRALYDPFCGSGTILIEAAMIARNIAPGILRRFNCEHFDFLDKSEFRTIRKEAKDGIDRDSKLNIKGSDYDRSMILKARNNTQNMNLENDIFLFTKEVRKVELEDEYGVIITNPPYGIRLDDDTLDRTYNNFKALLDKLPTWSVYMITDYEKVTDVFSKPDKNRKLYNGKIKTYFYSYLGPRPPKEFYGKF
ncbi:MAG: class I SAM-dependent RNA methyltransferase [Ezakiella sp.]|nr:class I SAM-dependent RNA methyltransferase [Ezakiella sp.]MDD7472118.1 class I SAM-dependent RNA methyltransferase [Bacillota bacterium]MDY3923723.1 class I SAM-dependent RNA methyltransferase [Ezakiella sp.]